MRLTIATNPSVVLRTESNTDKKSRLIDYMTGILCSSEYNIYIKGSNKIGEYCVVSILIITDIELVDVSSYVIWRDVDVPDFWS